ncbi:COX15/CtaA family protein [Cecembia calidifontis]|jgi:cytochrome c oxidase assembly protein subunit 15|uniref:Cytochrome c oxidase assembly protein subunit 15 n=1 Tax=Cecembia calidifontis TaxID=1187080 RepID=A0A4Q7P527_9BACT|nr:COX15/CtaA family protein [Cecembia calidifontis]RZS94558.1 cytochrome c oxidase assembly protein subunit 15 [Cecembia calidifontis]
MNQSILKKISSFRRISLITVIAVYFLILVGGIVRSTGSGMGCPDWPKCFGSWVPPTHVDQLPNDYQEIYLAKRIAKNEKFAAQLNKLGFVQKAEEVKNDPTILIEEEFNPVKTWIEYVNRLIGAVIGLLVLITMVRSFPLWSLDKWIPSLSVFNLLLVLFQAWIGSIVVSTNLLPWMITVHMVLALLIVCLLLYIHYRSYRLAYPVIYKTEKPNGLFNIMLVGFILMLIQIVLGTQVREEIDHVAFQMGNLMREEWVSMLGIPFLIHRSYSLLLLGIHLVFLYKIYKYTLRKVSLFKWSQVLFGVIVFEIITGVGMAYFAIPAFIQPLHLLFGSLIIGIQFVILLILNDQKKLSLEKISS